MDILRTCETISFEISVKLSGIKSHDKIGWFQSLFYILSPITFSLLGLHLSGRIDIMFFSKLNLNFSNIYSKNHSLSSIKCHFLTAPNFIQLNCGIYS